MTSLYNGQQDKTINECLKHSNSCTQYINRLLKSIQKEFKLGKIDRYSYEHQINLLTVVKLEIEHIQTLTKDSISNQMGVFIDVSV